MQGKTINGYTLQHLLGAGGMAEVWYAENKIGKKAAVKFLLPKLCADESIVARFQNEAKVMVQLEHPNIRQVYDYDEVDGHPCIIMEYLEGDDLKALLKQGRRFTDEELVKWWNQIEDALNYTHAQGVVHRDIKPSNIFLDNKGNIKLLDFGIAKNNEGGSGTMTGSTLGTRIYMSPEQVRDPKRVDYRTDLYSLAVSFVHLLTGKAPYDSTTTSDFEIQLSIVTKPLDLTELPIEWKTFLEPYLEKDPEKRAALGPFVLCSNEIKTEEAMGIGDMKSEDDTIMDEEMEDDEKGEEYMGPMDDEWGEETVFDGKPVYPVEETVWDNSTVNDIKELNGDQVFTVKGVAFVMKPVEGGSFSMGAESEGWKKYADNDEEPVHKVTISSFFMGETVVTQALWKAVMGDGENSDIPVNNVTWFECQEFIGKLNRLTGRTFRLPSEAEWEYAARGGQKSRETFYAGSDIIGKVAWYHGNSKDMVHEVKLKEPNELGLYDMSGNCWEWCNDWYGESYYQNSPEHNPQGPSSGTNRVLRGGSWFNPEEHCKVTFRNYDSPDIKDDFSGFRLAMSD